MVKENRKLDLLALTALAVLIPAQIWAQLPKLPNIFHKPGPINETKVQDYIKSSTLIRGCADPEYTFKTIDIAPLQKTGTPPVESYLVHANYSAMCVYGSELMRAEVNISFVYKKDASGAWKPSGPDFNGDQGWENEQNPLRCHVQNLAHLTLDEKGIVTGRTPATDQGYSGCTVDPKASE